MYPEQLDGYISRQLWKDEDCFKNENPFYFVNCYTHRLGETLAMHSHSFYEINIILSGSGRHYIGEKNCQAESGTVFVIPPHIRHGYYFETELSVFHILLSNGFTQRFGKELSSLAGYSLLFEIEPLLRGEFSEDLFLRLDPKEAETYAPLFAYLEKTDDIPENNVQISRNATVLMLISDLCKMAVQNRRTREWCPGHKNQFSMIKSMEYINEHCETKIDFEELAEDEHMSYATFVRHFKTVCGKSPGRYLTECRISRAKRLLQSAESTITEIALECGFYDSSHFIRTFKQITGLTPAAYQNRH